MDKKSSSKKLYLSLLCGLLGCLCFGGGDWLMVFGDSSHIGNLSWLSFGTAGIPQWRYVLAMSLAFPGILFYGTALFSLKNFISSEKHKKIYCYLNAFGLTPWLCLHLIYVLILSLFAWLNQNGFSESALKICEQLFNRFSWIVILSEIFMLPVFIDFTFLQLRGKTCLPRWTALLNVLVFFVLLKVLTFFMPDNAFRLGFINGLMSEAMFIWFLIVYLIGLKKYNKT